LICASFSLRAETSKLEGNILVRDALGEKIVPDSTGTPARLPGRFAVTGAYDTFFATLGSATGLSDCRRLRRLQ